MRLKIQGTRDPIDVQREQSLKQTVLGMTPEEGAQWVEDNVNNLQDAKDHLKRLTKIVIALAHKAR